MYLPIIILHLFILSTIYSANELHRIKELPSELQSKIMHSYILSRYKPNYNENTRFTELPAGTIRYRQLNDTRNDCYVNHILLALHFWNTDFMYDLVAFEIGRFRKKPHLIFSIDTDTWADELVCVRYIKRTQPNETENFKNNFQETLLKFTGQDYRCFLPIEIYDSYPSVNFQYTKPELLVKPYFTSFIETTDPISPFSNKNAIIRRSINDGGTQAQCADYTINCSIVTNENSSYRESYTISTYISNIDSTTEQCYWDNNNNLIQIFNIKENKLEQFPILPNVNTLINPFDRFFIEALCGFAKDKKNYPHQSFWHNKKYSFFEYPVLSPAWRLCNHLHNTSFDENNKKKIQHIIQSSITIPTMGYQFLRSTSPLFPTLMCSIPYYGIRYFLPHWYVANRIFTGVLWIITNLIRYGLSLKPRYAVTSDLVLKKLKII